MPALGTLIPRMLVERGVDTVFGIPGVHTVEMYRGLPGSGLRHVTPRHEQGAGFAADGYWRATGRVAACFIITGPGMTNIATAMGQAYGDSVPMIVISSDNDEGDLARGLGHLHELKDQQAMIEGVAAWSRSVREAAGLAEALDDALDLFATGRPRPVHIQIPKDRLSAEVGDPPPPRPRAEPVAPARTEVEQAAAALNAAQRPLLILGGGAKALGSDAVKLAEALGAPVLSTSNARGLIPAGHPLDAGGMLFAPAQRALAKEADVVLAIGAEFGPTDWSWGGEDPVEFDGRLIRVDVDPLQLHRGASPADPIRSNAALFASALLPLIDRVPAAPRDLAACRASAEDPAVLETRISRHLPLIEAIWAAHPDALLVGDSAEPTYAAVVAAAPPGPRQWWTITGFGTLGYALPAALGAKLAKPEAPVVALAGDGGALYTIQELAAAAEARTPVALLIWNNDGYGEIRHWMRDGQIAPEGVDLSPIDFEALAKGFGARYARAPSIAAAVAAIGEASAGDGPMVIEMREGDDIKPPR
ncbi:MAG: 5-guanidino-2-oxopentanoate decarboxylase [Pseudomonadota bacterium]